MVPRPIIAATLDRSAGVAYLKLSTNKVVRTVEFDEATMVDLDEFDVVVGLEFLDITAEIPLDQMLREYHIPQVAADYLTQLESFVKERAAKVTQPKATGVKFGSVATRRKTPC